MSNEKISAVRGRLNNDVARKTPLDVAEDVTQAAIQKDKEGGNPKLTQQEIAKIRLDHWKAMNGLDLDSRD